MTPLSDRQRDVARLVADGWTDKHIAALLGISDRRVRRIVTRLAAIAKADSSRDTRVQLTRWWMRTAA